MSTSTAKTPRPPRADAAAGAGSGPARPTAEPPEPPSPPAVFGGFWGWATAREDAGQLASRSLLIMIGGVAAFSVLAGAALLIGSILDFILSFFYSSAQHRNFSSSVSLATPVLLRGGELFLTLAAALLVFLIILTRNTDAILSLLGVLVIAAIIIPAGDIIRLGGVFGLAEADRDAQAFRVSSEGESVTYDRSDIFAKRIVSRAFDAEEFERYLNQTRSSDVPTASQGQRRLRSYLESFIAEESYLFQIERLENSVRQRGIARLLIEVVDPERARQMTMMPATIRAVRAELIALRDLGLVSASQADFHNLAITALGVEVACRVAPEHPAVRARVTHDRGRGIQRNTPDPRSPDCRVPRPPNPDAEGGSSRAQLAAGLTLPAAPPAQHIDVPVERIISAQGFSQQISVPRNGSVAFRVAVTATERALTIAAGTRDTTRLDPVISVVDDAGREIAFDDDSNGGFDAFLTIALPGPGIYEFRVRDFGSGSGNTTTFLRRASQFDERRAISGRQGRLPASIAEFVDPCPAGWNESQPVRIDVPNGTALFRCQLQAGAWTFDVNGGGADLLLALYRQEQASSFRRIAFGDDRRDAAPGRALDPLVEHVLREQTEVTFFLRDLALQDRQAAITTTRRTATPPDATTPPPAPLRQ